jgi:two-component system cell cycle sensor histidine kinase PleC
MFGPIDSRYAEYSRDIHESGLNLLNVINDILDMSRIEAGRRELRPEPLALEPALTRAIGLIGEQARTKNIEVSVCVRCEPLVVADDRALQQILANVLQNAVKFTPRDGAISIRARQAGPGVNLFIEDSGIGIPGAALAKIGRPFEQVESEFCRSHKGSGLGLAIARSLAELHGGTLRIRSQPGMGTIVMVHLPRLERTSRPRRRSAPVETVQAA